MGWVEKAGKIAKGLIPDIKAQVTESGKVTGINVHIGNKNYYTTMPEGADTKKISEAEITPAIEKRIEQEVKKRLIPYVDQFPALSEHERNQLLADSTSSSVLDVLSVSSLRDTPSKSEFKIGNDYGNIGEGASVVGLVPNAPSSKKPFGSDDDETM